MANHAPWVSMFGLSAPYGKCQCGCGEDAPISAAATKKTGREKGKPCRFVHGHNCRRDVLTRFREGIWVNEQTGCWEWKKACTRAGYGLIGSGRTLIYTHRLSYETHVGPIPEGHHVCHKCDNPKCCNPEHLFTGTDADNLGDMRSKGRGHAFEIKVGSEHHSAKLNESQVQKIRALRETGATHAKIAAAFSVSKSTICAICKGRVWTHVE